MGANYDLKVEQGLAVAPTHEQFHKLIQAPLRKRRERLGLSKETLISRTGLSEATIYYYTDRGTRTDQGRCLISTLAKIIDALDHPVTDHNFNVILSIGGSLLGEAVRNARPQLRPWRESEVHYVPTPAEAEQPQCLTTEARQAELNAVAERIAAETPPAAPDVWHGPGFAHVLPKPEGDHRFTSQRQGDYTWDGRREYDGGQRWVYRPIEIVEVPSEVDAEVERRVAAAKEQIIKDRVRARLEAEGLI